MTEFKPHNDIGDVRQPLTHSPAMNRFLPTEREGYTGFSEETESGRALTFPYTVCQEALPLTLAPLFGSELDKI